MFNNKRIKKLEDIVNSLGIFVGMRKNKDGWLEAKNIIEMMKKIEAIEKHLGIEYKIEETKTEGYVKKEENLSDKVANFHRIIAENAAMGYITEMIDPSKKRGRKPGSKNKKRGRKVGATKANGYKI